MENLIKFKITAPEHKFNGETGMITQVLVQLDQDLLVQVNVADGEIVEPETYVQRCLYCNVEKGYGHLNSCPMFVPGISEEWRFLWET